MRRPTAVRAALGATLTACLLTAASAPASAEISPDRRLTDFTAYTLNAGETQIGFGSIKHGFTNRMEIGTNFLADLFTVFNVNARLNLIDSRDLGLAVGAGAYYFNPKVLSSDAGASHFIMPSVNLTLTLPLSQMVSLSGNLGYSQVIATADLESDSAETINSVSFGGLTAEVDLVAMTNGGDAFIVSAYAPLAYTASIDTDEGDASGATTVDPLDYLKVTASYQWSWETFNLRLGGGYGRSIFGTTGFTPEFDIYWRW